MSDVSEQSEADGLLSGDRLLVLAILFVGVVGSGIARWLLGNAGFETLGMVVFVLGYGGMVFTLWYGWLRHMELTGPGGQ
ncbi:hypothetical protein SAMN04487949_1905 [Halogranum gelatinilyticum]|uniref:Uncharacterized protein n=1 Tax=Halogranum gelatinilyticum TaxID=660521 RepID=A0A1G9TTC6_9EURY|nr:hypothetical protein [Halogranum gelatinilyticum]SDM51003.1 hypothetical protein SAMN04487949_1905 [Halogranum gelatinilyticum]